MTAARDGDAYMKLDGQWIFVPERGKLHWPGCRYYKPMGPASMMVVFELEPGFWDDACKLCDAEREVRGARRKYPGSTRT